MRISRETQIQSVSSFACPASPRPLPCLFTLEYVPKMQPLRARPNAPAATIFQQCAQRTAMKTAAAQRRTPKRASRRPPFSNDRPTRRPFETSSDLPIISRIAPPRISFVENTLTLSVKYCAVPFARRHAHMLSPRAHNYSCHARARPMRRAHSRKQILPCSHARARPMRRPEPLQRAARRFPIQFESQYILSFIWRATAGRIRRFSA